MIRKPAIQHDWNLSIEQARALQLELAQRVILNDRFGDVRHVAGVDVGFEKQGKITRAAIAVLSFPELKLVETALARCDTLFPYVPGYLSFRELPAVMQALQKLHILPDLLLCDGQGIAHPRRFGIACHLGVLTDLPSIGVAKSRLIGTYQEPGPRKGEHSKLLDGKERIGTVLRTRDGVKPLYISPGHRISQASAVRWVLACTTRYRLPETTRHAHHLASG